MDFNCSWSCKATTTADPDTNKTTTSDDGSTSTPEEKYCIGGTDMYMQGFAVGIKSLLKGPNFIFTVWEQGREHLCHLALQQLGSRLSD